MVSIDLIKELDHKPNRKRLEIIREYLKVLRVEHHVQDYSSGTNLFADLGEGRKRIGISSHFDRVTESGGANDNGSAIVVCLAIIEKFLAYEKKDLPLRIFFFDEEETGLKGSAAYVKEYGVKDLSALINMELVGVGDRLALWPLDASSSGKVLEAFESASQHKNIYSKRFDRIVTNTSDHLPFRNVGLHDSFTVTCISSVDLEFARVYYAALNQGMSKENLAAILSNAPIFEHYHKPTDTWDKLDKKSLAMVADVIWETLLMTRD